jgi:hypothetical protein
MQRAMSAAWPLSLIYAASVLAQASAAILSLSAPERACIDIVAAAQDQPEQQASFTIYSRCRKNGIREGALEKSCRELARLYSVARHYSEASGRKLASEDFCATAIGVAVEQGPLQEVDACVAGAEEVLSSTEVTEAAENVCKKAHPRAAEAPTACRLYVKSLAEALRRAPQGELVDAEAICGQLVHGAAGEHRGHAVASKIEDKADMDERKFVTSCVQFAGSLMSHPGVGEDDVRKSCEAHSPSEEKTFCSGYARLVFQRADASQFEKFCQDEYHKMTAPAPQEKPPESNHLQKKASTMAMSMPTLCTHLFEQATSASISNTDLQRTANDLCAQELGKLPTPQRPSATRIRVGCHYFARRFLSMKEQKGSASNATEFCARITSPQKTSQTKQQPSSSVVNADQHAPAPLSVEHHAPASLSSDAVKVVAKRIPIQRHETLPAAQPSVASATQKVVVEDTAKVKSEEDFLGKFLNKYETKAAVAEVAPVKPSNQPTMKVFREDEMAEVRRKAEQLFGNDVDIVSTGAPPLATSSPVAPSASETPQAALAAPAQVAASPPVASVSAAVSTQATPAPQALANAPVAAATPQAAVAAPQVAIASKAPATMQVIAKPPVAVAAVPSADVATEAPKVSMLGVDSQADVAQVDASSDFLSSFLNAYTGNGDTSKSSQLPLLQPPSLPPVGGGLSTLAQLPTEAQAAPPPLEASLPPAMPQPQEAGASDVDSMVSAFLARN